ncbi:hypothetical protein [Lactobacillus helveticus]|nr:hypothetical protein [Lactobacillus helveticus]
MFPETLHFSAGVVHSNREEVDDIKKLLYDNIEVADTAKVPELIYTTIE